ncbi:CPBP family intramembrane glutamic endopeptidase [Constantimarinum furrinae]|uniref:Abortive infection protein n=1 Tax=Constantimarinum furrinae TaxID=2562285 RepID=A0A7G8PRI3_9FLAO|nr:type II CAAX endopeptidase family protein [Constantimarinum furrinae]QNJ96949.1 Abortive infection protein [Constantimarinum furrinae]
MKSSVKIVLGVAVAFIIYFIVDELYFKTIRTAINQGLDQFGISHILAYSIVGIPLLVGTMLLRGVRNSFDALGLNRSLLKALLFSLVCTAPMLIGFALVFEFNTEINLNTILVSVIAAAFFEELYFRGFLYGLVFRYTKVGFIPSILFGALLFAFIHLYQSQDPTTLIGIFLTTFLGAVLFAWVYTEWNYNIWVPVFLHLFMNLFWELFSAGENALGGVYSNVFRIITIVLIIVLTLMYKKRKKEKLAVNRKTLFIKPS